jgi:hypothetical protein
MFHYTFIVTVPCFSCGLEGFSWSLWGIRIPRQSCGVQRARSYESPPQKANITTDSRYHHIIPSQLQQRFAPGELEAKVVWLL